jgi:hypothetical protein
VRNEIPDFKLGGWKPREGKVLASEETMLT